MNTATNDKILDRVRKLLALAERAGTPEEAGTAYATAQKLIAQHALSDEQIRVARLRETGGPVDEPIVLVRGDAVTIVPVGKELTTQQAADVLNVSRQYLVRLLEGGKLAHRKTGKHRRVRVEDVLAFKAERDSERAKQLDDLAAMTQDWSAEILDEARRNLGKTDRCNAQRSLS